jgi:outer membrane protein W
MKKILIAGFLVAGLGSFNTLSAQDEDPVTPPTADYKTALGVRLSSSTAMQNNSISIKHFINDKTAIEGLFTFGDPLALGLLVEFHKPLAPAGLRYFYGAGGYIAFIKTVNTATQKTSTDPNIGAQGIIGLDYKFNNIPLNISLDWKPELNIVTDINFEPAAIGFSARFTFGK